MLKSFLKYKRFSKKYCSKPVFTPNSHCGFCGTAYQKVGTVSWPLKCSSCNNITFRNPIPVAVGMLPFITNEQKFGLLLVQRGIKPFIGELCLPGGFVDWGESWQEAITREIFEETNVITDPNEFLLQDLHSTPDNTRILIFGISRKLRNIKEIENFKPTNETDSVLIGDQFTQLCFSLHQKVYNDWFKSNIA